MDKKQMVVLVVSALTDFIITLGTALGAAMVTGDAVTMPSKAAIWLAGFGALVAAARTVQQKIKALSEQEVVVEKTKVEEKAKR